MKLMFEWVNVRNKSRSLDIFPSLLLSHRVLSSHCVPCPGPSAASLRGLGSETSFSGEAATKGSDSLGPLPGNLLLDARSPPPSG